MIDLIKETEAANAESINSRLRVIDKNKADVANVYTKFETDNKFTEKLTQNVALYVSPTGNDSTGDGTEFKPYKTINYALSKIPKNLNGFNATIRLSRGTYNESVRIIGFHSGCVYLKGAPDESVETAKFYIINNLNIEYVTRAYIAGITFTGQNYNGIGVDSCYCLVVGCSISSQNDNGVQAKESTVNILRCNISNVTKGATVRVSQGAIVAVNVTTGNNNKLVFSAEQGLIFTGYQEHIEGTTRIYAVNGGRVFGNE